MKQSVQIQLVEALAEVDDIRARLAGIARAADEGSAAPPVTASEIQTEYENRLKSVERKVESIKDGFARQIRQLTITIEAYTNQIEQLREQAAAGAITPRKFKRQVGKLSQGKVKSEETLSMLRTMGSAQSAADLQDVVPPPVMKMEPGGQGAPDLVVRATGGVIAFLLFVSVFMPMVSALDTVNISLFQAGRLAQAAGDGRGVLIWLTPLVLAIAAGSTSFLRDRTLRGGILLSLGTLSLAPLALMFPCGLFYPGQAGEENLMNLVMAATNPGIGAFVMVAASAGIYILGGVNLHGSETGKRWCTMTTVLLVLTCISSTVYCVVILNAKPSLTLSVGNQGLFGTKLDIEVYNGGNLPLIVREHLPPSAKRNEFVLKIQRRGTMDGGWTDVDTGLGTSVMSMSSVTVAPNTEKTIPWPASFETGDTRAMFRAVMVNGRGRVVESGEIEVVKSRGSDSVRTSTAGGSALEEPNDALIKAREKIDSLEAKSSTLPPALISHEVVEARSAANAVTDRTESEYLHRRIDRVLIDARDRQAQPLFDQGNDYRDRRLLDLAIDAWIDVIGIYEKEPRPRLLRQEPEMVKKARDNIRKIHLSRNPEKRFEVRGIMKRGDSTVAMLHDKLDERTRVAKPGEKIDDFRVEKIDETRGTVTIRLGRDRFYLRRP